MAITFTASPRTIVLCDFNMGGFRPPEMVKKRPAVVLVGRLPRRNGLVTVVPLSGTESDNRNRYHYRLELEAPLPEPFAETVWWAKADMAVAVSTKRLDFFRAGRDESGKRKYLTQLKVSEEDFSGIQKAVAHGFGLPFIDI